MVLLHTPLVINTSYTPPTTFNCNNAQTPFPRWESKCQELRSLIPKSPVAALGMVWNETRRSSLDHLRIRLLLDYLGVGITLPWSQHQTHGPLNISGWAEANPVVWSGGTRELYRYTIPPLHPDWSPEHLRSRLSVCKAWRLPLPYSNLQTPCCMEK